MSRFGMFGKITAVEGKRDELAGILLDAAKAMNALEECELYVVSVKEEEPHFIFVMESWSSKDAHQASLSLEAVKQAIQKGRPKIAGMEIIETFTPVGGKGLL